MTSNSTCSQNKYYYAKGDKFYGVILNHTANNASVSFKDFGKDGKVPDVLLHQSIFINTS